MGDTVTYRWIGYTQHNIPGNQSFTLSRHASLSDARDSFVQYCRDVSYDDCSMTLYAFSDEAWAQAEKFRDVGCPFDYPDRIVERGPAGGVLVSRT